MLFTLLWIAGKLAWQFCIATSLEASHFQTREATAAPSMPVQMTVNGKLFLDFSMMYKMYRVKIGEETNLSTAARLTPVKRQTSGSEPSSFLRK